MFKKLLLLSFALIMSHSSACKQKELFYSLYGTEAFRARCNELLNQAGIEKQVSLPAPHSPLSFDKDERPVITCLVHDNSLSVVIHRDIFEICSDDELSFLILAACLEQKLQNSRGWRLAPPALLSILIPMTATMIATTATAHKIMYPDSSMKDIMQSCKGVFIGFIAGPIASSTTILQDDPLEKKWWQTMVSDVLAPGIGLLAGLLPGLQILKIWQGQFVAQADKQAAKLVSHDVALAALKKLKGLPRECDGWFDTLNTFDAEHFEKRYNNLVQCSS